MLTAYLASHATFHDRAIVSNSHAAAAFPSAASEDECGCQVFFLHCSIGPPHTTVSNRGSINAHSLRYCIKRMARTTDPLTLFLAVLDAAVAATPPLPQALLCWL